MDEEAMDEEAITEYTERDRLSDVCAELVAGKQYEDIVRRILSQSSGQWMRVRDVLSTSVEAFEWSDAWDDELYVITVADPCGDPNYAMFFFHHCYLFWTMTARYNVARLRASRDG